MWRKYISIFLKHIAPPIFVPEQLSAASGLSAS